MNDAPGPGRNLRSGAGPEGASGTSTRRGRPRRDGVPAGSTSTPGRMRCGGVVRSFELLEGASLMYPLATRRGWALPQTVTVAPRSAIH